MFSFLFTFQDLSILTDLVLHWAVEDMYFVLNLVFIFSIPRLGANKCYKKKIFDMVEHFYQINEHLIEMYF